MISPCDLHVPRMLRNLGRPLALLLLFDIVVVVAYVYFAWRPPVGAPVPRSSGLANRFR
jgi:hypothetical protein